MKASRIATMSAAVLVLVISGSAFAQAQPGGQGRQRGGNNGGNFDPAAMRQRYMTQLKEQLGSPDEEWKLLEPKVDKLLTLRRDNRGGGGGPGGRNGGGRNRGGNNNGNDQAQAPAQPQSAVAVAQQDLRKAVEDKSTAPEELTKKIAALREAREKAKADLAAAQKDLRELLSARQEAVLISNGLLE